ncbi:isochorismatase family protein [Streptomyces sp. NPDC048309]|uniref:isochorismatase family protein n=1 Tax=Streptomyces sp. NPDC048309 TaxID=3154618 RepID=UPI0034082A95
MVKACHAVFYETLLSSPLRQLAVVHVVLSGQLNEQRVLHSALEAHLRPLDVNVSKDAVASIQPQLASVALERAERDMGARITTAKVISFTGGRRKESALPSPRPPARWISRRGRSLGVGFGIGSPPFQSRSRLHSLMGKLSRALGERGVACGEVHGYAASHVLSSRNPFSLLTGSTGRGRCVPWVSSSLCRPPCASESPTSSTVCCPDGSTA